MARPERDSAQFARVYLYLTPTASEFVVREARVREARHGFQVTPSDYINWLPRRTHAIILPEEEDMLLTSPDITMKDRLGLLMVDETRYTMGYRLDPITIAYLAVLADDYRSPVYTTNLSIPIDESPPAPIHWKRSTSPSSMAAWSIEFIARGWSDLESEAYS